MTYDNSNAILIRMNKSDPKGIKENIDKKIAFTEDMQEVVIELMKLSNLYGENENDTDYVR